MKPEKRSGLLPEAAEKSPKPDAATLARATAIRAATRWPGLVALLAESAPEILDMVDGEEAEVEIGRHVLLLHREGPFVYVVGVAEAVELAEVRRTGRERQAAT